MGLFDKVRQVIARVVGERPASDPASQHTDSTGSGPEASQGHLPSPGTAQPAQTLSPASPEPTPGTAASDQPESHASPEHTPGPAASEQPESHESPEPPENSALPEPLATATTDEDGAEPPERYRTHTIQPDQSLAEVAELHGVGVDQVAELNGLDPELIFAGQVVRIPHV